MFGWLLWWPPFVVMSVFRGSLTWPDIYLYGCLTFIERYKLFYQGTFGLHSVWRFANLHLIHGGGANPLPRNHPSDLPGVLSDLPVWTSSWNGINGDECLVEWFITLGDLIVISFEVERGDLAALPIIIPVQYASNKWEGWLILDRVMDAPVYQVVLTWNRSGQASLEVSHFFGPK